MKLKRLDKRATKEVLLAKLHLDTMPAALQQLIKNEADAQLAQDVKEAKSEADLLVVLEKAKERIKPISDKIAIMLDEAEAKGATRIDSILALTYLYARSLHEWAQEAKLPDGSFLDGMKMDILVKDDEFGDLELDNEEVDPRKSWGPKSKMVH